MPILLELLLLAFVLGVGLSRLEKLRTSLSLDPAALVSWLQRHPGSAGPAHLARALTAAADHALTDAGLGAVARLAEALAEPDAERRAAGCNEALVELEPRLAPVDGDGGLVRLLALGTLLDLALLVVAGQGTSRSMLDAIGLGAGALALLLAMRRDGGRVEQAWRQGLDRWVEASLEAHGVEAAGALRSGRTARPGRSERLERPGRPRSNG